MYRALWIFSNCMHCPGEIQRMWRVALTGIWVSSVVGTERKISGHGVLTPSGTKIMEAELVGEGNPKREEGGWWRGQDFRDWCLGVVGVREQEDQEVCGQAGVFYFEDSEVGSLWMRKSRMRQWAMMAEDLWWYWPHWSWGGCPDHQHGLWYHSRKWKG